MKNKKCMLLREISRIQFAAWELHLYLDTHQCDEKAMAMSKKYSERARELLKEYEDCYGPLTAGSQSGSEWLADPWPWDVKECDC